MTIMELNMKKMMGVWLVALFLSPSVMLAEVKMPGIFADGMVLQRDKPVPVWGWADVGAEVTVAFAGQKKTAKVAATNGDPSSQGSSAVAGWRVMLDPMPASSAPQTMTVTSSNLKSEISNLKFTNVLIGDVWLCSGQSNMEMPMGFVSWTGGALNYEEEIKNSANPLIRQFRVEWDRRGYSPKYGDGTWLTAGPETTDKFSATGYFFARELQKKRKVPVAIIHASQGATAIEWWMSREAMLADPECRRQVESQTEDFKFGQFRRLKEWAAKHEVWEEKYGRTDARIKGSVDAWVAAPKDGSGWKKVSLPGSTAGLGCRSGGVLWLRREVELPAACTNGAHIWMGGVGDVFSVYVNSVPCGTTSLTNGYGRRIYALWIPKGVVRAGSNVVAFRARSFLGTPSFRGAADQFKIKSGASETALAGEWLAKVETEFAALPRGADARPVMENGPGIHYYYTAIKFDWVIRPLIPYALNGVVWYQGEHNTGRPQEYRKLIKMFVNDWRNQWHCPDLPFYICQLPNNGKKSEMPEESGWAELREAQSMALELPGTYLANLIDNAEDGDLHPRNKQEVGHRLALLALANTYGDKSVACYGPMYESMKITDGKAIITFKHAEDGLVTRKLPATYRTDLKKPDSEIKPLVLPRPNSEVQGFALCEAIALPGGGTSNQWVWANAKIVSASTVEVQSDKVAKPIAVRYAWANNPVCNLYNKAGLPAFPFRTDVVSANTGSAASPPTAARAETGSLAEKKGDAEWAFTPDPKLPNVLLLGDSISIGYTLEVRKRLAGKANVYRPAGADGKGVANCGDTGSGLRMLERWLDNKKWDVIHFNWGLHDMKRVTKDNRGKVSNNPADPELNPVEQYAQNLETLVQKLKATGARLIFATTTPVVPGTINPLRTPDAPAKYNQAAEKIMAANGVKVNDLYTFVLPEVEKLQLPKNVHFTPEGSALIGKRVAEAIETELENRLETILARHSAVLNDVYTNVAAPYKAKGRTATGYHIGNGEATVTASDEKGKWSFIVSPRAYWHGDSTRYMSAGWSGRLDIRIPELVKCEDYRMTLDLYRGELRGAFRNEQTSVTMKTHVVRDADFMVTSIENTGVGAVTVSAEVSTSAPYNPYSATAGGAKDDIAYVTRNGRTTNHAETVVCYTSLGTRFIGAESKATSDKPYAAALSAVTLKPSKTLYVVTSYETSVVFPKDYIMPDIQALVANQTDDPVKPMLKRLGKQTEKKAAELMQADVRWWNAFWKQSHVDIPSEPLIEKQWYGRLFLAACMCREGSFPPGLFAWIFNEKPAWGSDYHWNFNTAFVFNGLSAANHPELVKPYCDLLIAQAPLHRGYAHQSGEKGIRFYVSTTPYGVQAPPHDWGMHHSAADSAMNMITWYQLTRDTKYMREKLYPFLKEIAENSESFIAHNNDRNVLSSYVAEFDPSHRINTTTAIAFTSRVLASLVEYSRQLNVDANLRTGWEDTLKRMSPVPLVTTNGVRCLSFSEDNPSITANSAPYPLESFYPALWFNRESPEALYARNFIKQLYLTKEIGKSEVFTAHFFTWVMPQAIRCQYPVEDVLKVIRTVVDQTMLPNFTYWDQRLSTEHQVIDAINAMFLQSVNGKLIVFPNWKMETDASFYQLREDGAFLVSSAVKKGAIGDVMVTSEKGLSCRVQNPWPGRGVKVESAGAEVAATRNADDTYSFGTQPGATYRLCASGTAPVYTPPPVPERPDDTPRIIENAEFVEDFSKGRGNWLFDFNGWTVQGNALCFSNAPGSSGSSFAALRNRVWADATYEFDLKIAGGKGRLEVQFRKDQPLNCYHSGIKLIFFSLGSSLDLSANRKSIAKARVAKNFTEWRHVKITTRGPAIRVYLDNDPAPVMEAECDGILSGAFMLYPNDCQTQFRNIKITPVAGK